MKRILVVDDSLPTLIQISSLLSGEYEVSLATSGFLALQICVKERPDLILLDIEMPELDGFGVFDRIKQSPYLKRIPVIFFTANHDVAMEIKALESGARDYFTKPVERSILLHRIELHLRLTSYQMKTEETVMALSDNIAFSFAEFIEYRDKNTGGHVVRTSSFVDTLGREMIKKGLFPDELNPEELKLIVRAASLHDLGKLAISDRILLKADRLNDEEFSIMKRHTIIGKEMLERMYKRIPTQNYLYYAALIAASHHEHYDGTGYPCGIKGDDIPLCARIMAVADVYDALMADRIYHAAMSHIQACDIITGGKGTMFDPRIVEVFEKIKDELNEQYKLLSKEWESKRDDKR
jgi:putative two-component system response regulator